MKKKIPSKSIDVLNDRPKSEYPTYTSDFMNYSNRYSHATRKENVGNMSQLFPQFLEESEDKSLESWKRWYLDKLFNLIAYKQILFIFLYCVRC